MITVQRLGWTLLHFFWQGTAIAIVYAMLRGLFGRSYGLACAALIAMAVAPPLTFATIASGSDGLWTVSVSQQPWLMALIVTVWLLGVIVFSIRLLGGWRFAARLRSTAHPAPADWQQTLERIAGRMEVVRRARLLISSLVAVPTVIGWLRPVILLPVEALTGLPAEQVSALLAHEIAHIRRHDYLASILQSVVEAVLFYHPAVWWISEQIRCERELCCDDLAVAASGDVLTYARALATLESQQRRPLLAANGGSLVERIRRLIEPEREVANSAPGPAAAWAMAVLWIAGVGVTAVHGAQTPPPLPVLPVNRVPVVMTVAPSPFPVPASPVVALAGHARRALLFDPLLAAQPAEDSWSRWLNEDVVYIISAQERAQFLQLTSAEERERFVEEFWLRRDPTPDTVENEFKDEHYRRIAYANQRFAWRVPGWKTDRGRIYITLGPPDEIDSHPSGGTYKRPAGEGGGETSTYPFEDWRYRYIEGIGRDVVIEFVDTTMSGEYRMTMDRSEKEAFLRVPNSSPTLAEQMGISSPTDRLDRTDGTHMGSPPAGTPNSYDEFTRLEQFAKLQQAPKVKFKDLAAAVNTPIRFNILPMKVQVDYMRVTVSSTMANVTMQFSNRDLQFDMKDGAQKAHVNLFGRITTMTRRPVSTFEKPLEINLPLGVPPDGLRSVFQQSVPLAPGRYRLSIVAKDLASGNVNNYEVALDVPQVDDVKLASSSLVLADDVSRLPTKTIGGGMFAIGDYKVRPRLDNTFTPNEKLGIYLQVYNFKPDENTGKPTGSIAYEIDKAAFAEKVLSFSEEVGKLPDASASQVTIVKQLPLRTFAPGAYTLKITVTDRNGNQTLQHEAAFTVKPE